MRQSFLLVAAALLTSALVAPAASCAAPPASGAVDPDDVTEAAVRAGARERIEERLSTSAEGPPQALQVEILLHEVRQLADREAPTDLVVAWASFSSGGRERWALAQLFRHRAGADVSWRWHEVADPAWLPLFVFDEAPDNDDVVAFLAHWDFEEDGRNGALLAGEVKAETWRRVLGEEPPVAYPEGTPAP